ncbi:MAG: EAL domain-containing protein [Hormoscilla sp. GUM202]|nr:EAL domain-containing protein [Hormoscilla sp. GUM202]
MKIDRLFVQSIGKNPKNQALTKGIIQMAHEIKAIASGVETVAERDCSPQNQCDEMQGYLFSRPLNAKAFQQLLFS